MTTLAIDDGELEAEAKANAEQFWKAKSPTPGDSQVNFDVALCLSKALERAGVPKADQKPDWKPDGSGLDQGGWGMTLADLERLLKHWNDAYEPYRHKPQLSAGTYPKTLSEIRIDVAKAVKDALKPRPADAALSHAVKAMTAGSSPAASKARPKKVKAKADRSAEKGDGA